MFNPLSGLRTDAVSLRPIVLILALASCTVVAAQAPDIDQVQPPQVGELAPGFSLSLLAGDQLVTLADFAGKQDVVLVFGSYT